MHQSTQLLLRMNYAEKRNMRINARLNAMRVTALLFIEYKRDSTSLNCHSRFEKMDKAGCG